MTNHDSHTLHPKECGCSGATIIEVLVAITLLFIALTAALYAQSRLAESLGTKDLSRVETLADSLMVTLVADTSSIDTTIQLQIENGKYIAEVTTRIQDSVKSIRITVNRRNHDKLLHTLYYESQSSQ
jgi:Tfp pilus assembly protein PilV